MPIKFALIGDGAIAKYHREAIKHVGGELIWVLDPKYSDLAKIEDIEAGLYPSPDYVIIASPSNYHRSQIKMILTCEKFKGQIICEKPAFLPWEMPIDSDRINIVLQLRYLPNLPKKADLVSVRFVRDEAYFKSWKGDARNTGGLFCNLFIHYIHLAQILGADFEGVVSEHGEQERFIRRWGVGQYDKIDILNIDNQACYNRMYEDIIEGKGIKPRELFYLSWTLARNSEIFGYGKGSLGRTITIKNELM